MPTPGSDDPKWSGRGDDDDGENGEGSEGEQEHLPTTQRSM